MRIKTIKLFALCLFLITASVSMGQTITALWDFQNCNPSSLSGMSIQSTTGEVQSTVDGVVLKVDATDGKLAQRSSDAQFNTGTKLQVPVQSANDIVTVVSYPNYHNYTVGGVAADADKTEHKATTADVRKAMLK